jgi:replicative DNA helicase
MDKIPPQSLDAELSTLGSMMIEKEAALKAIAILSADDFYRPANSEVFDALHSLVKRDEPADLITLQEELRNNGKLEEIGGTEYLMSLVESVPTAANVEHYANIVKEKSTLRQLISLGTEIVASAHASDAKPQPLVERLTEGTLSISGKGEKDLRSSWDIAERVMEQWESYTQGNTPWVVPTSLTTLNFKLKGGVSHGQLIVYGAGTSQGKSVILHDMMINAGKQKTPTLCFSGEMSGEEIQARMAYMMSRVDSIVAETGHLDGETYSRMFNAQAEIAQYPLMIQDIAPTLAEFRAISERWALQHVKDGKGLIVVDYGELIEFDGRSENEEVKQIYKTLKYIARRLNVPVATGAQIRKKPPTANAQPIDPAKLNIDTAPIPALDDLIGSSAIRNYADKVVNILNPQDWNTDINGRRQCYFCVAKHRGGRCGRFTAWYTPAHTRFDDVDWRDDS